MSYNPNIERILIEQIQEFKELDLQELDPNDPALDDKLILIAYNIATRNFFTFYYDLTEGSIIINNNAFLTKDFIVNTDELSTPRGFVFRSGWALDNIVDALCNPPTGPTLSLDASPYLIEVNTSTSVTLQETYVQNSAGLVDSNVPSAYMRGSLSIPTNIDALTITSPSTVTYSVTVRTLASPQYPVLNMIAEDTVKGIYPFLIGAGTGNTIVDIGTLIDSQKQALEDIATTDYLIANFPSLVAPAQPAPKNYYWFAVHQSFTPISWVAVDSGGNESTLNKGPIETGFSNIGNMVYKGNSFSIWMGIQDTFYASNIKIKF